MTQIRFIGISYRMQENITDNISAEKFRLFLQDELIRRCKLNPAYSLRAFARDLKTDHSAFSKILSGKRPIGQRTIKNFLKYLTLGHEEIKRLIDTGDVDDLQTDYKQLAIDSFAIISDWHHYAILELLHVESFESDINWIANALCIKMMEAKIAIERLKRVGLLEVNSKGQYIDASGGKSTNISNDMTHGALRKMQKQLLEKSIESIDQVPYEKRSNTSMTMAIDTKKLPKAYEEIKKFRRKMGRFLGDVLKKDQVYNLSIALCPLSNINEEENL